MKDERTHYDSVDKSESEPHICVNASISFVVMKTWPYPPSASGFYSQLEGW